MQQSMIELRQKQANGTLTAERQAWLEQAGQRGGRCIAGTPRGPGAGTGVRAAQGVGKGHRRGLRDGTGPRNGDGTCVLDQSAAAPGAGLRQRRPR